MTCYMEFQLVPTGCLDGVKGSSIGRAQAETLSLVFGEDVDDVSFSPHCPAGVVLGEIHDKGWLHVVDASGEATYSVVCRLGRYHFRRRTDRPVFRGELPSISWTLASVVDLYASFRHPRGTGGGIDHGSSHRSFETTGLGGWLLRLLHLGGGNVYAGGHKGLVGLRDSFVAGMRTLTMPGGVPVGDRAVFADCAQDVERLLGVVGASMAFPVAGRRPFGLAFVLAASFSRSSIEVFDSSGGTFAIDIEEPVRPWGWGGTSGPLLGLVSVTESAQNRGRVTPYEAALLPIVDVASGFIAESNPERMAFLPFLSLVEELVDRGISAWVQKPVFIFDDGPFSGLRPDLVVYHWDRPVLGVEINGVREPGYWSTKLRASERLGDP